MHFDPREAALFEAFDENEIEPIAQKIDHLFTGGRMAGSLQVSQFVGGSQQYCIAPGFIKTAMTDAMPEEVRKQSLAFIPVGHWGEPEDIAAGYVYLASDEARFVSGICLTIDGGAAR
jgi:NAD(P)-dependent dehydrogenase (short-subunit alcohol dehydrogenase family)